MVSRSGDGIEKVQEQLCWDSSVDTKNIQVELDGDSILLKGSVPDYLARVNAFRDAFIAADGREIINRLTVAIPQDVFMPSDEMLEMNIRTVMAIFGWLDADKIKVRVARRQVYLSGSTEYLWQKNKLEKAIGEFKGVTGITNDIEVKTGMDLADNRVARDIIGSIDRISGLDSSKIAVNVVHGRVFLDGKVQDPLEMAAVERIVAFTRGVRDVVNNLRAG